MTLQVAAPVSRYKNAVLADSPISYWRCNEAVGASTIIDTRGVANATCSSTVANGLGRQGPTQGDRTSGALGMVSVGNAGALGSTSAFSVGPPFTVECWVMTTSTATGSLVTLNNPSSPFNGYVLALGQGGAGKISVYDSNNATWATTGTTVNDGQWHHVVAVYSGTSVTIYKDGVSTGTVTLSAAPTPWSGGGMRLLALNSQQSPVYVSEIAVYSSALSAGRIAAHYNAALTGAVSDRIELLTGGQTWDSGFVLEPNLWWDGSKWCMIYTGGIGGASPSALGYATCTSDPTVPGNWTLYASNPIIGQGAGGVSGNAARGSIFFDAGTLYVFFANTGSTSPVFVASGADALHLGTPTTALAATGSAPAMANTWVVKNGATYYMMFESQTSGGGVWKLGYATASSPAGPYTIQTFPIASLELNGATGSCSGPWFTLVGSTYHLWFHAAIHSTGLPGRLYKSTSTDLVNWTTPALALTPSHRHEYDQVADPMLVIPGSVGAPSSGPAYLLWDGDDNVNVTASIFIARPSALPVAA